MKKIFQGNSGSILIVKKSERDTNILYSVIIKAYLSQISKIETYTISFSARKAFFSTRSTRSINTLS